MDIYSLKEQILELKLRLFKIQREKNESINCQLYEKALQLRELESHTKRHFENLKCEVLRAINTCKPEQSELNDYVMLQSLLFEFDPLELQNECVEAKSIKEIDNHVERIWKTKEEMQNELLNYLREEYKYIKEQMHQFTNESDHEKAQLALNRLAAINDLILSHKP